MRVGVLASGEGSNLQAILDGAHGRDGVEVVALARPALGRTRTVEVLRGGRSKVLLKHGWDGLPHYGTFGHLSSASVLERVDELLEAGALKSSGGHYPVLEAA